MVPFEPNTMWGDPASSGYPWIRAAWEKGLAVLRPTPAQLEQGLALHRAALVIDTFSFLPQAINEPLRATWEGLIDAGVTRNDFHFQGSLARRLAPAEDAASAAFFLEALQVAGVSGLVNTAAEGKSIEEDIARLAACQHVVGSFGSQVRQLRRVADFSLAHAERSVCVSFSVNGPPHPGRLIDLEDETRWLATWYHLGVRLMHLSYNRRNAIATGCAERHDGGLSELGYEFVRAMNRVGIVVDVPHSSELSALQAAEASEKPIMASHTGCRAVFDHVRAKSDQVLRAIADTGGLVGIVTIPHFLGENASLHTLLDHVDHAVRVIGADHVAIGTDQCAAMPFPAEWKRPVMGSFSPLWWGAWDPQRDLGTPTDELGRASLAWTNWPLITVGLVMRGYREEAIRKILGLNLMRVLAANERKGARVEDAVTARCV